jgi:hypothetical protein
VDIEFHGTERTTRFPRDPTVARSGVPQPANDRVLQIHDAGELVFEPGESRVELRDASFRSDRGIVGDRRSGDSSRDGPIVDVGRAACKNERRGIAPEPSLQVTEVRKDHLMDR